MTGEIVKVVQSWWRFRLTRASDGKKVVVPVLFMDDFDDDGKIITRYSYWECYSTKIISKNFFYKASILSRLFFLPRIYLELLACLLE
jgi:hypothetical protein